MKRTIYIGADIVPTESNYELFKTASIEKLIGNELKYELENSDFTILNLETPLTDTISPIKKCGPNLYASTDSIDGLVKINPYFDTLANNHILDQGENGLKETIEILKRNNIEFSGVGKNLEEADSYFIKNIGKLKLGIYCCAEHEFSIATESSCGVNPYDPLISFDRVKELKLKADYVIVLYHGGKEHYRYPSPMLQKVFRKFADAGANLVIAQHTHCIGCEENYNGSKLIYGQGNFLFDHSESEYWKTSLLLKIVFLDNNVTEFKYLPIVKKKNVIRLANSETAEKIMDAFTKRSVQIQDKNFIKDNYLLFAQKNQLEYYSRLRGRLRKNIIFRIVDKLLNHRILKHIYSSDYLLPIENCINCEAHRELLLAGIEAKKGSKANE